MNNLDDKRNKANAKSLGTKQATKCDWSLEKSIKVEFFDDECLPVIGNNKRVNIC